MKVTNMEVYPEHPIPGEQIILRVQVDPEGSTIETSSAKTFVNCGKNSTSSWTKQTATLADPKSPVLEFRLTPSFSNGAPQVGDIVYFGVVINGTYNSTAHGYDKVACIYTADSRIQPEVPVIDMVFTHDENGGTSDIKKRTITFAHPVVDCLLSTGMPRAATKINRSLSKNVIYINFPTQAEDSGGYGYDLGFVEDTFTFTIVTTDWKEYERVFALCKSNTGEVSGNLHIGKINNFRAPYPYNDYSSLGCKTYKVILRSSDADFDPGTYKITYTIKCTIVYNGA